MQSAKAAEINMITVMLVSLLEHLMCCLYFGRSWQKFALLKSPQIMSMESECFSSMSIIWLAMCCNASLNADQNERGKLPW